MSEIKLFHKVTINTVYGGFRLSQEAAEALALRKRAIAVNRGDAAYGYFVLVPESGPVIDPQINLRRDDPDLIAVAEALGPDRTGADSGRIEVREVEILVHINDHDGKESVSVSAYA